MGLRLALEPATRKWFPVSNSSREARNSCFSFPAVWAICLSEGFRASLLEGIEASRYLQLLCHKRQLLPALEALQLCPVQRRLSKRRINDVMGPTLAHFSVVESFALYGRAAANAVFQDTGCARLAPWNQAGF